MSDHKWTNVLLTMIVIFLFIITLYLENALEHYGISKDFF